MTTRLTGSTQISLRCPEAIPNSLWLKNEILWVDKVAAFWPNGAEPTPLNKSQVKASEDVRLLIDHNLFEGLKIEQDFISDAVIDLDRNRHSVEILKNLETSWSQQYSYLLVKGFDSSTQKFTDSESMDILHHGKFPNDITEQLLNLKLIQNNGDGSVRNTYRCPNKGLIPWLITLAAANKSKRDPRYRPAPSSSHAMRMIIEPNTKVDVYSALSFVGPPLPSLSTEVSLDRILELKTDEKFIEARDEYRSSTDELNERYRVTMLELISSGAQDGQIWQRIQEQYGHIQRKQQVQIRLSKTNALAECFRRSKIESNKEAMVALLTLIPFAGGYSPRDFIPLLALTAGSLAQVVQVRHGVPELFRRVNFEQTSKLH